MNSSIKKLLLAIDQALDEQGLSDRGASMTAVGQPDLIKNMRRGQMPSYDRVLALLRTLDIDPVTLKLKFCIRCKTVLLSARHPLGRRPVRARPGQ